ncbi:leucyl/phenylalanyl-tRNA--protein transferase [Phenylobacterium sp. LjRoot164]|uniref:leucyl/phenylalanyl-tRNA--protein transferase n=1 Tax=unclassified Phenylobacterium TaxID=2640670 RepID=UPI003ECDDF6A
MKRFGPRELLECYGRGVFPMADAREDDRVFLIDPEKRGVVPLDGFHVSRRLARTVRGDPFDIRIDTAFSRVVLECAAPKPGRTETWINGVIEDLYAQLFEMGHAHSVECWLGDELVGGLYGVSLGAAFFGESMFSRRTDASKVALVHLVARLLSDGYRLLDAQFITDHLSTFGAVEIPRAEYHRRLARALEAQASFQRVAVGTGAAALQVISQAS